MFAIESTLPLEDFAEVVDWKTELEKDLKMFDLVDYIVRSVEVTVQHYFVQRIE